MKKLTAVLLVLIMLLGLCACTQPKKTDEPAGSNPPSASAKPSEEESPTQAPAKTEYTLTFKDEKGEVISTQTVKKGETPTLPTYSREDTEIIGFYTKEEGKGKKFEEAEIKEDTTFYLYTLHQKMMNNQCTSSEDDIDVIHVGLYEFTFADGKKLGYSGTTLGFYDPADSTAQTQFLVSFQNSGKDSGGRAGVKYVIYAGDSVKDSIYYAGSTVSIKESNDRLYNYLWYIIENEDGTVSVKNSGQNQYITNVGGACKVTPNPNAAKMTMTLVSEEYTAFNQIISEEGNIIMRYGNKLERRTKLRAPRMTKLTNDMQLAMNSFYAMTDFLPYESIVIRIYQDEPYYGYVYGGWNVISFNIESAISDLGLMPQRDRLNINDWNFCLLHEMGHMFDWNRGWRFYGEFSNNFKLAQVLYDYSDLNAAAATAGWSAQNCFTASEIKNMWNNSLKGKSMSDLKEFNLDRMLYIFVVYAERIGWENVTKAYKELQAMETQVNGEKNRFWAFTDAMAKYAPEGLHIKDILDEGEIDYILNELK